MRADTGAGTAKVPALCFEGVTFRYPGAADAAVSEVCLSLDPGEMLAVVGGNGSGKSTLALLADGIHRPQEGDVRVLGLSTRDTQHLWQIRRLVGLLFQDPDDQIVGTSVEDDVAFGLENLGVPRDEMLRRVAETLRIVGLEGEGATEPHLLSGGQRQRLALAGVLAVEPSVLVLDEPTSMLDVRGRRELLGVLRDLRARGAAVLLVTQRMEETLEADQILALERGRTVYLGPPREFFCSGAYEALPVEEPPALRMARRLELLWGGVVPWSAPSGTPPLTADELMLALGRAPQGSAGRARGDGGSKVPLPPDGRSPGSLATTATPAALLSAVEVTYDAGAAFSRTGLTGVDLELRQGEVTAIVGATAAGKSTLLQVIAGLLPPSAGTVQVLGGCEPELGTVTLLFQHPERQLYCSTVEEDVAAGLRYAGLDERKSGERARQALRLVGLDPSSFGLRSPFALSVGEQKRVALAGLLVLDPRILALDEPGAGLDPRGRRELRETLRRWMRGGAEPRTVVFSGHDLEEVLEFADRVVVLKEGAVVSAGPPLRVLADEDLLVDAGLEPPLAAAVAAAVSLPMKALAWLPEGVARRRSGAPQPREKGEAP